MELITIYKDRWGEGDEQGDDKPRTGDCLSVMHFCCEHDKKEKRVLLILGIN